MDALVRAIVWVPPALSAADRYTRRRLLRSYTRATANPERAFLSKGKGKRRKNLAKCIDSLSFIQSLVHTQQPCVKESVQPCGAEKQSDRGEGRGSTVAIYVLRLSFGLRDL